MSADPSNMRNFTVNSYNLIEGPASCKQGWCVKPGSIYTNPKANFNYFNSCCGDPYTYYNYWYRRFPNQTNYLNCYNLPYKSVYFKNASGYVRPTGTCKTLYRNPTYTQTDKAGFKYFG
jgi:hypothetical protein